MRSTHEGFADALRWHLSPFRKTTTVQHSQPVDLFVEEDDLESDPSLYSYFRGSELVYKHVDLGQILREAVWDIHASVPRKARDFLFLHAGVVSREGQAVLLPARMDCGKSSLTLALLHAGWDYLSDELAPIDPVTRRVYPFPKLIGIDPETLGLFPDLEPRLDDRQGLSAELGERFVRPGDVGSTEGAPSAVAWIVFPTSDFGGPARLTPLSSAAAVEGMATNCFNLFRYGERGVELLARVAKNARAFTISGGDPTERAELITRRLEAGG